MKLTWPKDFERVWSEDECTRNLPGHETDSAAYQRIFGEPLNHDCGIVFDFGDHFVRVFAVGIEMRAVVISYDGAELYKAVK